MTEEEKAAGLAIGSDARVGSAALLAIRNEFGSYRKAITASVRTLSQILGSYEKASLVKKAIEREKPDWWLERYRREGVRPVFYDDEDYPSLLKEIADPPAILYFKGQLIEQTAIAIVGSRKASLYGRSVAQKLARELSEAGLVVVSGLALGIDRAAHLGAIESGRSWAVLGTGLDQIYPANNFDIARKLLERGALISEFPFETPALKHHFPMRNRIIAGLCLGTIVIEAGERSGALITARLSLESNRELFAVPHDLSRATGLGPNRLLKIGAHLVQESSDVLTVLGIEPAKKQKVNLDPEFQTVVNQLELGPLSSDDLAAKLKLPPDQLSQTITFLELQSIIERREDGLIALA